jgi:hypothetical protein
MVVEVIADTADRTGIGVNGAWLQPFKGEMLQKFLVILVESCF